MSLCATADVKKGVAMGGRGGGGFRDCNDSRCDKRVLLQEILKYCVNREGPTE